ncbi:hypothetical protein KFU94_44335 [Chloroflexi bacterium TSY]|nr:hypothetical protein [Chloroflexi bacterium TSY]
MSVAIIENSRGVQTIVTGGKDKKAKVWQIRDGKWTPTVLKDGKNNGHDSWVHSVAIIENSRGVQTIVTGGLDGKTKVWSGSGIYHLPNPGQLFHETPRQSDFSLLVQAKLTAGIPLFLSTADEKSGWQLQVGIDGVSFETSVAAEKIAATVDIGSSEWAHLAVFYDVQAKRSTLYLNGHEVAQESG